MQQSTQIIAQRRNSGVVMVLVGALLFALKGIFIKKAYQYDIDSSSLLAFRMLFSLPLYVVIMFWDVRRGNAFPKLVRRDWYVVGYLSFMGYFLASLLNFEGMKYVDASLERIVLFVYPTFVLAINAIYNKRPILSVQVVAILLSYIGIMLAYFGNLQINPGQSLAWGIVLVLLSGLVYSFYLVGSEGIMKRMSSLQFTYISMILAVVPIVVFTLMAKGLDMFDQDPYAYLYAILMAVFSTVIPTFLFMEGIQRVGSTNMSIIASIGPIFTIFLASWFLGEILTPLQIVGTGFVLAGVYLISRSKTK